MNPVGRNDPCPCGSGKRYKECHGALGAPALPSAATAPAPASPSWVPQALREAIRAHQSGRGVEAAEVYRRVLSADPSNFQATHLLGLVEYEDGRYDQAMVLLEQAIGLRPALGTPRHNLRLVESMLRVEMEVCREVLPRLAPRVELGIRVTRLAAAPIVNIVIGNALEEEEHGALSQIVAACGATPVTIWDDVAGNAAVENARLRKLSATEHPHGGILVLLGTARSPAAWLPQARAEQALLVATRDEPCEIIDRIDELAAAGFDRPGLVCVTGALADRLRLPHAATLLQRTGAARVDE